MSNSSPNKQSTTTESPINKTKSSLTLNSPTRLRNSNKTIRFNDCESIKTEINSAASDPYSDEVFINDDLQSPQKLNSPTKTRVTFNCETPEEMSSSPKQNPLIATILETTRDNQINDDNKIIIKRPSVLSLRPNRELSLTRLQNDQQDSGFRISRFLSVTDIPEEAKALGRRSISLYHINEHEENEEDGDDVDNENYSSILNRKKKAEKADHKAHADFIRNSFKREKSNDSFSKSKNKLKSYHDGSGIPQNIKVNIIRNILKNYNVEHYIDKFTACDVVEIKLESYNRKLKPIRDRLVRLMNSDVIRLNDVRYMQELANKVEESFKEEELKLIESLRGKEHHRERRLIMQGLLEQLPEHNEFDNYFGKKFDRKIKKVQKKH